MCPSPCAASGYPALDAQHQCPTWDHRWHQEGRHQRPLLLREPHRSKESQSHQWMPRVCELDVDNGTTENTYATKKVILEVELEVGVLLDGTEDLK
jgi:hypothetical protein